MIVTAPADILKQPAESVTDFDEAAEIVAGLTEAVNALPNAAGLAAPQIGVSKRVFVFKRSGRWVPVINPVIVRFGVKSNVMVEECFSLPGVSVVVERPTSIGVTWTELDQSEHPFDSLAVPLARAFQHEYDHLDGKLITDYGPARISTA